MHQSSGENSEFPWSEWHYERNSSLEPFDTSRSRAVWWKCHLGHEWKATTADRIGRNSRCPFCINKKVWPGFNDLETVRPDLAKEWHPKKNGEVTPRDVVYGSGKKFWWQCHIGHEWLAQLHSRATRNLGCKICSGQVAEVGKTDLATKRPDLVAEWNFGKNDLLPTEVMQNSHKKVWWTCPEGHDYEAWINNRSAGNGCPFCAGKKYLRGFNDLQTISPELAKEWHPTKNGVAPSDVKAGGRVAWWWLCKEGHEYKASRSYGSGGCPYCLGKKLMVGFNDLATAYPELLVWWDASSNSVRPNEILRNTNGKFHWICPQEGHPFEQTIYERRVGAGCPVCVGKHVVRGVNDLTTSNPLLASQWDLEKNTVPPTSVTAGSHKLFWWKCPLGHSWRASAKNRNNGDGCPFCGNSRLLIGFNDLATVAPRLVPEWDQEANDGLSATEVCVGSDRSFQWKCSSEHTWRTRIRFRLQGGGCRICAGQQSDPGRTDLATTHPSLAAEWHPTKNLPLTPQDVMAGTGKKIWWQCPEGHEWKVSGNSRLNGSGTGCPACVKSGYDPTKPALLYFIKNKELNASKVGITGTDKDRLRKFQAEGWAVVQTWQADGFIIADAEVRFFRWLRGTLRIPAYLGRDEMPQTGGFSETFEADSPSDSEVILKIRDILQAL